MKIFTPETYEYDILKDINGILNEPSPVDGTLYGTLNEMSNIERKFLNGIIRQIKPKKLLEVGVSAGGSSVIILNAIKDMEDSKLYSIDILKKWHFDTTKNVGYLVNDKAPNLSDKWKLYTGGTAADFMEDIGDGIDFCLLDTAHRNPGELLDFLMILPYMKRNAVIVIHDIMFHTFNIDPYASTCNILFSSIKGQKVTVKDNFNNNLGSIANIGAIILDDNIMDDVLKHFLLLTLPWKYFPDNLNSIIKFLSEHYDQDLIKILLDTIEMQKKLLFPPQVLENNIIVENKKDNEFKTTFSLADSIFSVKENEKYKIFTIFGFKITLKK